MAAPGPPHRATGPGAQQVTHLIVFFFLNVRLDTVINLLHVLLSGHREINETFFPSRKDTHGMCEFISTMYVNNESCPFTKNVSINMKVF